MPKTALVRLAASLGLAITCALHAAQAQWYKNEQAIMGTDVIAEVWSDDPQLAQRGIDAVMREMRRIDDTMSPYKPDSELSLVNREAAQHPVKISRELYDLIARSLAVSNLSGGAFDITFASVGYMYDYRDGIKPTDAEIKSHLSGINYHHIHLDPRAYTIRFDKPGVRIDLGGIAKGHAVDNCIALLEKLGIHDALVTAGGDTRILGTHHGRPWMTGIRDPRNEHGTAVVIPLSNTAVSTSGDYERYFIRNGVRYHHILNPKTGKSVHSTRSATVLGPDATTTDALSTTLFVLGPKRAMALVETLPGIDAIIIDATGVMHYSSGLEPPPKPRH